MERQHLILRYLNYLAMLIICEIRDNYGNSVKTHNGHLPIFSSPTPTDGALVLGQVRRVLVLFTIRRERNNRV